MKTTLTVLTLAALAGAASAAEISGKVKLNGTPPPEKTITPDAACGKLSPKLATRHYVVSDDKGLANVFVYVKEGAKAGAAPTEKGPLLDQVGCQYLPYVMGVQTGQHFDVKNSDSLLHNVHTLPKVQGNKERNVGQPVPMKTDFVFDKPEVLVQFKCEVHPWMFAYVGVVEHPYFSVTDKDGSFKISGLPAGDYTVEVVHLKAGRTTQKVTVGADDKKALDFTLEAKAPGQ
ncbi:MAG TPA: carboxypeptidase regulatory-like domain-containing protein [Candidatus Limnocylindria bacterium]|nr:carboxypeptidase regulatory-like domain-containing protein [Candidatus Limnocylindria bacterium]